MSTICAATTSASTWRSAPSSPTTRSSAAGDTTCNDWTSNREGSAIVGHHDRAGLNKSRNLISWNSSHGSRRRDEQDPPKSGGAGLFYCIAVD
ncbi:MAG: hypothetical protein AAF360_17970 [Pseudomonadota bacterium]